MMEEDHTRKNEEDIGDRRKNSGRRVYPQNDDARCVMCDYFRSDQEEKWINHNDETKSYRSLTCQKLTEIKTLIEKKADKEIVEAKTSGIIKLLTVLVGICCIIVAGQAIWLKSDIGEIKTETKTIHKRISETDTDREALKDKMNDIQWSINALTSRLFNVEQRLEKK